MDYLRPALEFLKSILGPMLKLGLDGLDAFVTIALFIIAGTLFGAGMEQGVVAVLVLAIAALYFWRRDRSDTYKARIAELEIEKVERELGQATRDKARKRLTKNPRTDATKIRDGSDAASG